MSSKTDFSGMQKLKVEEIEKRYIYDFTRIP